MNKEKRVLLLKQDFQKTAARLLDLTLDKMAYPDFDPLQADRITAELLAAGRLAIAPEGMKGLCV